MANVIFKVGTKALFDALEQKDTNTLYWLEDVQELYKGNLLSVSYTHLDVYKRQVIRCFIQSSLAFIFCSDQLHRAMEYLR